MTEEGGRINQGVLMYRLDGARVNRKRQGRRRVGSCFLPWRNRCIAPTPLMQRRELVAKTADRATQLLVLDQPKSLQRRTAPCRTRAKFNVESSLAERMERIERQTEGSVSYGETAGLRRRPS